MLNSSGESGHPSLDPDLRVTFSLSPMSRMLPVDFHKCPLSGRVSSLVVCMLSDFYRETVLNLSNSILQ